MRLPADFGAMVRRSLACGIGAAWSICVASAAAQPLPPSSVDPPPALYVLENVNGSGGVETQRVLKVDVVPGPPVLTQRAVCTVSHKFFFHFGGHRLVENRYAISKSGGVIDLSTGSILHDPEFGELRGCEKGVVYYRVPRGPKRGGYFRFDLRSGQATQLETPGKWAAPGVLSPSGKMTVRQEWRRHGNALGPGRQTVLEEVSTTDDYHDMLSVVGPKEGKRPARVLAIEELHFELSKMHPDYMVPGLNEHPFLWLDDHRILTQRRNGELVMLGKDGTLTELMKIGEPLPLPGSYPRLWQDLTGRVIYEVERHTYEIDVSARKAKRVERWALGHGFEMTEDGPDGLVGVLKDGQEIGRWKVSHHDAKAAPGRLALLHFPGDHRYSAEQKVAIWTKETGWQHLDCWPDCLLGWASVRDGR